MLDQQTSRWVTRYLVYFLGLIWLGLALVTAVGLHPALPADAVYRWGLAGLAFLTGLGLVVLFRLSQSKRLFSYYALLGILVLISVSFIFDEVGWIDVSVFLLHLSLILLLLRDRDIYLQGTVPEG